MKKNYLRYGKRKEEKGGYEEEDLVAGKEEEGKAGRGTRIKKKR